MSKGVEQLIAQGFEVEATYYNPYTQKTGVRLEKDVFGHYSTIRLTLDGNQLKYLKSL